MCKITHFQGVSPTKREWSIIIRVVHRQKTRKEKTCTGYLRLSVPKQSSKQHSEQPYRYLFEVSLERKRT